MRSVEPRGLEPLWPWIGSPDTHLAGPMLRGNTQLAIDTLDCQTKAIRNAGAEQKGNRAGRIGFRQTIRRGRSENAGDSADASFEF